MLPCQGLQDIAIPCDEICLKELRNKKLQEAFGIAPTDQTKPPTYSELLLNAARAVPTFIRSIEAQLIKFLKSSDAQFKFSAMDNVQRQIIHELAKYYLLDTESIGQDSNRLVVLTRRTASRPPLFSLSQVVQMQNSIPSVSRDTVQTHGSSHLSVSACPMSTLHLYDLTKAIKTTHLQHFLREFEGLYTLQWIDEANALAIFHQPGMFLKALDQLTNDPQGLIKVKSYRDSNPNSDSEGNVILGEKYVPPSKRPQPERTTLPEKSSDFRTVVSGNRQKRLDPVQPVATRNQFSLLTGDQPTPNGDSVEKLPVWGKSQTPSKNVLEDQENEWEHLQEVFFSLRSQRSDFV